MKNFNSSCIVLKHMEGLKQTKPIQTNPNPQTNKKTYKKEKQNSMDHLPKKIIRKNESGCCGYCLN